MEKYTLYDSTDDSVVCDIHGRVILFDSYEEAEKNWIGHPEEVKLLSDLPKHHRELILKEYKTQNK